MKFKNDMFTMWLYNLELNIRYIHLPIIHKSNGQIKEFLEFLKVCISKHVSGNLEWDQVVPLACVTCNFLPKWIHKGNSFSLYVWL